MTHIAEHFALTPIGQIKPYHGNSRKHGARQIDKIAASIAEFGFNAPILIDSDGTIVAGHGRYAAAQKLGMEHVPTIQLGHLTDAKRKAYIIADNRLAEDATWDMGKLAAEVQALQMDGMDLLLTGLDDVDMARVDFELRKMAADLDVFDAPPQPSPSQHVYAQQPQPASAESSATGGGQQPQSTQQPEQSRYPLPQTPVAAVNWVDRTTLKPNHYNPNHVAPPELELLITSIIEDGWTQPIVALPDGTIVDGFHRYTVSADPRLQAMTGCMVPVVTVDFDPMHRMMSTIRHNRARGEHGVLHMASIVRQMYEEGVPEAEIQKRLGMEDEEVERLLDRSGMTIRGASADGFGRAWVPAAK